MTSSDTSSWPSQYPSGPELLISGLGTTRAAAGGFENQRKIDYDLNLELAKAAKEKGTKYYVLISSQGANSGSMMGYPKMLVLPPYTEYPVAKNFGRKGELEDAVKEIGFEKVVIIRPGLLVGARGSHDSRPSEFVLRKVAGFAGGVSGNKLKDFWAQDADVVAKAAVRAGLDCIEGKQTETVKVLGQADVVRMGRTEWKD